MARCESTWHLVARIFRTTIGSGREGDHHACNPVRGSIPGVDLTMVGWILFAAGLVWLVIEVLVNRPRSRVTEVHESRAPGEAVRREEQRDI